MGLGMATSATAGMLMRDEREAARETEFAALVDRQARTMFRVAMAVLRRAEDAEDAVQEAFLRMYRGEGWRAAREERAYAARVAWRVAVDRAGARGAQMEDVTEMELAGPGEAADERIMRGNERERLRRLIEALPEELRQALVLCAIEEMTSAEVGKVMGIPEGTVRTRVMRAKEELRKRFLAVEEGRR